MNVTLDTLGALSFEGWRYDLATTVPMDRASAPWDAAAFAGMPGQAISDQTGELQISRLIADARLRK
jgi:hypothetical protein